MAKIALVVEYSIQPGKEDAFIAKLKDHAMHTLKEEPGCVRFEVCAPIGPDGKRVDGPIVLVEQYADMNAIAVHQKSPRLAALRDAIAPLITGRRFTMAEVL